MRNQVDREINSWRAVTVLGLACLFYFYEFLLQISPSVMGSEWMRDFNVTANALGTLAALYFYPYSGTSLLVGILVDRFGPHKLLTLATLLCAVSSIVFSYVDSIALAGAARFVIGFGSAFAVISAFKLAANWFSHDKFAAIVGIIVTIGMLGAMTADTGLAIAVDNFGWRACMLFIGLVGLGLALLIFLIVRDQPLQITHSHDDNTAAPLLEGLMHVLKNGHIWIVACYGGLVFFVTPTFGGLWGVPYLMEKYSISTTQAGSLCAMIFIGWVVGGPLWGWFSDWIGRRKPSLTIGAVGALITISLVLYLQQLPLILVPVLLFLFGFFSSGFLPAFSVAREITQPRYTATGLGFMNMINMIGIPIAQQFIGKILDYLWMGEVATDGVRIYSQGSYEIAMLVLPGALILAIGLLPFIQETYCHQLVSNEK